MATFRTNNPLIINHFTTIKIEHIMCSSSARFQGFYFPNIFVCGFLQGKILVTLYSITGRFETYPYNLVWSVLYGFNNDYEAIALPSLNNFQNK